MVLRRGLFRMLQDLSVDPLDEKTQGTAPTFGGGPARLTFRR